MRFMMALLIFCALLVLAPAHQQPGWSLPLTVPTVGAIAASSLLQQTGGAGCVGRLFDPPQAAPEGPPAGISPHVTYRSFTFGAQPMTGWRLVREPRFPELGAWVPASDAIVNYIPPGADEKALVAATGGLGITSSIVEGITTRDCAVIGQLAFERKGAPAILLRAAVDGEVTGEVLSLVLYEKGINLWRYDGSKWHKAGASAFPVEEGVFHRVKAVALGPSVTVWVDGKKVLAAKDVGLDQPGAIGIWAGEGPCYFKSLRIRYPASR